MAARDAFTGARAHVTAWKAEWATALVLLAGWLLLTAGVAYLTAPVVWLFSLGILCLSLGGWRLLATIVWAGMYDLTRDRGARRG